MINFFRKVRKSLLNKGKLGDYIKYAFGEIALVVVGILIALQINIITEDWKTEKKIVSILKEIQFELGVDIVRSNEIIDYYYKNDSLLSLVINNQLTYDDYKGENAVTLTYLLEDADHIQIHNNGYTNLIDNVDDIPGNLKSILAPLYHIYIYDKFEVELYDKRLDVITDGFMDDLAANKSWYYKYNMYSMNDTIINYLLNDPFYKNSASIHKNVGKNMLSRVSEFKDHSIEAYKSISKLIDDNKNFPEHFPHHSINVSMDELNDYVGTYEIDSVLGGNMPKTTKFIYDIYDDHLFYTSLNDLTWKRHEYLSAKDKILKDKRTGNVSFEFLRNAQNEVDGYVVRLPDISAAYYYKKIK